MGGLWADQRKHICQKRGQNFHRGEKAALLVCLQLGTFECWVISQNSTQQLGN